MWRFLILSTLIAGCQGEMPAGGGSRAGASIVDSEQAESVTVIAPSPIAAGTYSGTVVCVATTRIDGNLVSQDEETSQETWVFSNDGIPLENGIELAPGREQTQSVGGVTINMRVVSVVTTAEGVVVDWSGTGSSPAEAGGLDAVMEQTDTYVWQNDDTVFVTANLTMAAYGNGSGLLLDLECSAEAVKPSGG